MFGRFLGIWGLGVVASVSPGIPAALDPPPARDLDSSPNFLELRRIKM